MTSLEAYQALLEKINRNDSNSNISVSKGKFVNVYNQQALVWLGDVLPKYKASQQLDDLSDLLVDDLPLVVLEKHRDHVHCAQPEDYFDFSSSHSLASKNQCTGRVLINWNTKSTETRVLLQDANSCPSFEYEETLLSIASKKIRVYFTDFTIDQIYLSYYRKPVKIDVSGYIKIDGSASTDIDPDVPDEIVNEILDYCAAEIMRNNENPQGLQFSKDRL